MATHESNDTQATRFQPVLLRNSVRMSESQGAISGALAKAQSEIEGATKDHKNPHFGSKYADLNSVREAGRTALAKNGIAVIQFPVAAGKLVTVTTRLAHASGEWLECDLACEARGTGPQEIGAVVTYLRRFGLAAMTGVAPDDDDDGETASGRPPQRQEQPASKPAAAPPKLTKRQEQARDTWRMLHDLHPGDGDRQAATAVKLFGPDAADETWIDEKAPAKVMADGLDKLAALLTEAKANDKVPF